MTIISKEQLLKQIEDSIRCSGRPGYANAELRGVHKVVSVIESMPAIDGELAAHWIEDGYNLKCSVCGSIYTNHSEKDMEAFRCCALRCPHCGCPIVEDFV